MQAEAQRLEEQPGELLSDVLNISAVVTDAAAAAVDDSFLKCFTSMSPDPWNWNVYLMPAWLLGLVFRCERARRGGGAPAGGRAAGCCCCWSRRCWRFSWR